MRGGRDSIAYSWVTTSTLSSNSRHEVPPRRLPPRAALSQDVSFSLKTGRLASPLAKAFHWTHRCFIAQRRNGDRY
jgi:hypothetical protein